MQLENKQFEQRYLIIKIMWGALFAAVFMYMGLAFVVSNNASASAPVDVQPVASILYGLSCLCAVGSFFAKKLVLNLRPQAKNQNEALGGYQSASMTPWALCESIGIYGLLLTFISHQPIHAYTLGSVSGVMLMIHYPKYKDLEAHLQRFDLN